MKQGFLLWLHRYTYTLMKIHNQQDPAYNVNTVEKIFIEMVVMPGVMDLHDRDTVKVFLIEFSYLITKLQIKIKLLKLYCKLM